MTKKLRVVDAYGSGTFDMEIDETGKLLSMKRVQSPAPTAKVSE